MKKKTHLYLLQEFVTVFIYISGTDVVVLTLLRQTINLPNVQPPGSGPNRPLPPTPTTLNRPDGNQMITPPQQVSVSLKFYKIFVFHKKLENF